MGKTSGSTGRLKTSLHPVAHHIVFPPKQKTTLLAEFEMLSLLSEAHLVALTKENHLSFTKAKKIFNAIRLLKKESYSSLLDKPSERGAYLLFEGYLIETLGMDVAGSLHMGRSRNDINATSFKLNLRNFYKEIYIKLYQLRKTMLQQADQYMNLVMPVYSQFQVAQVGTYAYYLLAVEEAFARDQHFLKGLFPSLDESPLGAACGCGTSFKIDYKHIASLLGFSRCSNNALEAVANRDLVLRMLSSMAIMGTTLSRLAQDYQLWTTQEFAFFELPDDLCGSSSMMPQKKNPYLFEVIKGKSASLHGMLSQALTAMHNVPFSNSVEVGTEALQGIDIVLKKMCDILTLSDLLISRAIPQESNLINSINKGVAAATGVAEFLVKENKLPFRQAHSEIGSKISKAISDKKNPTDAVYELLDNSSERQSEIFWAQINEYGGGPGKHASKNSYKNALRRLGKDKTWIDSIEKQWTMAENKLRLEIKKIMLPEREKHGK